MSSSGQFVRSGPPGAFEHHGEQFDIHGNFTVPRSPQRHPVILQAGDSDGGRELAAATSDAIFSRHSRLADGQAFYVDIKSRLAKYGRSTDELKIIPATTYVLGDSAEDAAEKAHVIRRQQVSPQTAILLLEQLWNRDLSAYDAEGPLPDDRSRRVGDVDHPGPGPDVPRPAEDGGRVAGSGPRPRTSASAT